MKRLLTVIACAVAIGTQAQPYAHDWENPHVVGINKLPYHATLQLPSREAECAEIHSLDGQWYFHWSPDPDHRPADFWQSDYDVSQWDRIAVPGNWQMYNYGPSISISATPSSATAPASPVSRPATGMPTTTATPWGRMSPSSMSPARCLPRTLSSISVA